MSSRRGIILVNLGTPESATSQGVRQFLRAFLHDRRVVDLPRWIWWPLLHAVILPLRGRAVARHYAAIWTPEGSPLLAMARRQCQALQHRLQLAGRDEPVALAMTYGEPSLARAWHQLQKQGVDEVLLLPLYPQYSSTTTGSVFDAWSRVMATERNVPGLLFPKGYHDHPAYILALVTCIRRQWQQSGQGHLLFSFHGLPQHHAELGDVYPAQCHATARLVVEALGLKPEQWSLAFQSRFGREPWLQPYTDQMLDQLANSGISHLDVICPGFAADCLETLMEIAVEGKSQFMRAGGKQYRYIPALNDDPVHIDFLTQLIAQRFA